MKNKISILVILLLLGGTAPVFAEVTNRIVAIVNNEIITYYELEKAVKHLPPVDQEKGRSEEFLKQILFQLIDQKLVEIQIKRLGIQISTEDVEKSIARLKQEQGLSRPDEFAAALAKSGMTEADLKAKIKEQLQRFRLVSREIGSKIVVPELKIQEYFQKNKSTFQKSEGVHLAHIVLTNPENASAMDLLNQKMKAEEVWERLKKGGDFADLARSVSQDATAAQGGDLGFFSWEEIDPSLKKAISSLKPGEFSQVLQTPQGWQIVKLVSLQVAKEVGLEDVREQIREKLFQEEVEIRFEQWVQQLKDRSYIQVLL